MEETLPPRDIWQCLETFWIMTKQGLLLACSMSRRGILLTVLWCAGQLATAKSFPAPTATSIEVVNPGVEV